MGKWPSARSGAVLETGTTWGTVDYLLRARHAGRAGRNYARPFPRQKRRGRINHLDRPQLSIRLILCWADTYFELHGVWPKRGSGPVDGAEATWSGIDSALQRGSRGLPGGSSLVRLLKERREVVDRQG